MNSTDDDLNHEDGEAVLTALAPLLRVVHRTLDGAIQQARLFFRDKRPDPYLFPALVRYHFKEQIESDPMVLPEGAFFDLLPNNGLKFSHKRTTARLWKADEDGHPPIARGSNSMIEFYQQSEINLRDVFGDKIPLKLILLWDVDASFALAGLKLICPRSIGSAWQHAVSHWEIAVPDPATELAAEPIFSAPAGDIEALQPKKKENTGKE